MGDKKLSKPKDRPSKTKKDASKKAATLSLNVFTETRIRSQILPGELMDGQVGHTWISLKFDNPKSAVTSLDLDNPTRTLVEKEGETSMGFWPLKYRPNAFIQENKRALYYTTDEERTLGYTPGAGASRDKSHSGCRGQSLPWKVKNIPGRVEEPDRAHQDEVKVKKEYDLTYEQVKAMLGYVNSSRNKDYHLYNYNCTTFAVEAVKAAGQTASNCSSSGICLPNALYKELYQDHKRDKQIYVTPLQPSDHPSTGRKMDVSHDATKEE